MSDTDLDELIQRITAPPGFTYERCIACGGSGRHEQPNGECYGCACCCCTGVGVRRTATGYLMLGECMDDLAHMFLWHPVSMALGRFDEDSFDRLSRET